MDENHSDHDKSARSIRKNENKEFSILASSKIETTRKDRRKQKNPQRWQEQKKVHKSTTGRKKAKKINKKDKGRGNRNAVTARGADLHHWGQIELGHTCYQLSVSYVGFRGGAISSHRKLHS